MPGNNGLELPFRGSDAGFTQFRAIAHPESGR